MGIQVCCRAVDEGFHLFGHGTRIAVDRSQPLLEIRIVDDLIEIRADLVDDRRRRAERRNRTSQPDAEKPGIV